MPVAAVSVSPTLRQALNRAGDRNGVDFTYLLATAMRESRLDPQARAATSSAVGLFQFVEPTWLEVIKEQGEALGYGDLARQIVRDPDGTYSVPDPAQRAHILSLREDPQMAADLAAAFTRANGAYLSAKFGRMPSPGELYIAHFLGARGAERFFTIGLRAPEALAAENFPRQAAANPAIFYDAERPRTIREVYRVLVAEHRGADAPPSGAALATQQMAGVGAPLAVEVLLPNPLMSFVELYRAATPAPAAVSPTAPAASPGRPDDKEFASFFSRLLTK